MYPVINIFGRSLGSYGLCMAAAVVFVGCLCVMRCKRCGLVAEDVLIVAATTLMVALPTGSVLYVFVTYTPEHILKMIMAGDFSVFMDGGIVFYGGLIGGVVGALFGCRIAHCVIVDMERTVVPLLPLGHAIGRIGCLLAGCCYGFEYDGVFCIHYPASAAGLPADQGYFPVQLLEAFVNVGLCFLLLQRERKVNRPFELLLWYLGSYGIARFVLEFLRGDAARGIWWNLSLSQWISLMMLSICALYCLFGKKANVQLNEM